MEEVSEDTLEMMNEVGEDEGEAKDKDEPDEPDAVTEQIEQKAQQTRAQVDTDRVEPAGAEYRVHPEAPARDPAREREQRRQQLRAKLKNAQQEQEDLRFMLQELERQPTCPERRYSRADARTLRIRNCTLRFLRRNPTTL